MKTLISAQDDHVARILDSCEYSERGGMRGLTLLNRKAVSLRASRGKYIREVEKLGFNLEQARITMKDAEDMAELEFNANG